MNGTGESLGNMVWAVMDWAINQACPAYPRNALRRDGTSQRGRFPVALGGDYFQIDERGLEDLLDFTLGLAREIRFDDGNPGSDLDWQVFFRQDPSVALAQVLRYRYADWQVACETGLKGLQQLILERNQLPNGSPQLEGRIQDMILRLVQLVEKGDGNTGSPVAALDEWCTSLAAAPTFQADFVNTRQGVVGKQVQDLARVRDAAGRLFGNGERPGESSDRLHGLLARAVAAVGSACAGLQARSRAQFLRSLEDYPQHSPHMGLFIAFLRVHGHAQSRLNELGMAHLNHYYKEVLRFAPKEAQPDQVHLVAALNAGTASLTLPAGTPFAGNDKQVYALEDSWSLNHARIGELLGLRRQNGLHALRAGKGDAAGLGWPAHAALAQASPAVVGWAFGAQVLRMRGGLRRVKVGIMFASLASVLPAEMDMESLSPMTWAALTVQVTTSKGWQAVPVTAVRFQGANSFSAKDWWMPERFQGRDVLLLELRMEVDFPAVVSYDATVHGTGWDSGFPLLQCGLAIGTAAAPLYDVLSSATVLDWNIAVGVGDKAPLMENDQGRVDASNPFAPFGPQPVVGSRWAIDISEAASKQLQELSLNWFWERMNAASIDTYFAGYPRDPGDAKSGSPRQDDFMAALEVYYRKRHVANLGTKALYEHVTTEKRRIRFGGDSNDAQHPPDELPALPREEGLGAVAGARDGYYLQFTLTGPATAYGHHHYVNTMVMKSEQVQQKLVKTMAKASEEVQQKYVDVLAKIVEQLGQQQVSVPTNSSGHVWEASVDLEPVQVENYTQFPNPPFTPMITEARLWYLACEGGTEEKPYGNVDFYHLTAHGHHAVDPVMEGLSLAPLHPVGGSLYIGLEDAHPPCQVNLLVQLQPGSGEVELAMPDVTWQYLSGNAWCEFAPSEIAADGSRGLRQSGVVRLNLPSAADLTHTVLPTGKVWLRLQAQGSLAALDRIAALHPQAVVATLERASSAAEWMGQLPAGSLSKPRHYVAGLKAVQQPYPSFGGRARATDQEFQVQVAERLGHKHRSIALCDYERMVLEHFPEVYRVKCVGHARPGDPFSEAAILQRDQELAPGHVMVVCIPQTPIPYAPNPLEPKCRRDVLTAVAAHLQAHVPPFVTVHAVNPTYLPLQVQCKVAFKPWVDGGTGVNWLEEAIARSLCPWAFDTAEEIQFGGDVHESQLLNLIEQQPYVDVVAEFNVTPGADERAAAMGSRTVLVAAQAHAISAVAVEHLHHEGALTYGGIGFWRVHEDFIVNGN